MRMWLKLTLIEWTTDYSHKIVFHDLNEYNSINIADNCIDCTIDVQSSLMCDVLNGKTEVPSWSNIITRIAEQLPVCVIRDRSLVKVMLSTAHWD